MKRRIFLWGLSNGISALSVAGLFWLGLALGPYADRVDWYVDALVMLLVYGSCAACIWGAVLIRRRSGFKREDLKSSNSDLRTGNRKTVIAFLGVVVIQALLVGSAVIVCNHYDKPDLIWSFVALIVSMHFVPLGRIFGVSFYYWVGILGCIAAIGSFACPAPYRMMSVGIAMGTLMLASSAYLVWRGDALAPSAEENPV